MKYLFLDTNILLHYIDYEQINWKSMFDDDDITIVITDTVLREIDKHKDSSRGKIQKTAKKYSSRFREILMESYKSKINVVFTDFPAFDGTEGNLKSSSQDDCILLSAIQFESDNTNKYIITSDNGMIIRCKRHQFNVKTLDDQLRKKDEPSEEEQRCKELEQELSLYKNALPKPELRFSNGESLLELQHIEVHDIQNRVDAYKKKLESDYPHKQYFEPSYINGIKIADKAYPDEDVDKYNAALDEFINKKCSIFESRLRFRETDKLFHEISFSIYNNGTAKTDELAIQINFPEGENFYDESSLIEYNVDEPEPPELASELSKQIQNALKSMSHPMLSPYNNQGYSKRFDIEEEHLDINKPIDKKDLFYDEIPPILQCLNCNIEIKGGLFIELSKARTITFPWAIVEEKHPKPIIGELKIIIK